MVLQVLAELSNNSNIQTGDKITPDTIFGYQQNWPGTGIYLATYLIVIVVYCIVPEIGKTIFHKAVLRYCIESIIGHIAWFFPLFCEIYLHPLSNTAVSISFLTSIFFINSLFFWISVICIDITRVVTGFRRLPLLSPNAKRDEANRKFAIYKRFVYGVASMPTLMAAFFEFWPQIPSDFMLKINCSEYKQGSKLQFLLYMSLIPAVSNLFLNNALIILTSYKVMSICRSTGKATNIHKNHLKKEYFMFLKLYFLMGGWLFIVFVFAFMEQNQLAMYSILITRVLWLLHVLSDRRLYQYVKRKLGCTKAQQEDNTESRESEDYTN